MTLLRQNQNVKVVLTLSELALSVLPNNWLFVFELEQNSGYTYKKQFVDISDFGASYNLFEIEAGVDIDFEIEGDYFFKVYQMPTDDSLDELEGHLVHDSQMRLVTTYEAIPTFTVNTDEKIYKRNSTPTS